MQSSENFIIKNSLLRALRASEVQSPSRASQESLKTPKKPVSASAQSYNQRNHFGPEIDVALEMTLQVLHAFFRDQILCHVIARHILSQTGEADRFAPLGLTFFGEEIIEVNLQRVRMRRIFGD